MVIDSDSTEIVLLELELEISLGSEGRENSDGLGNDFGTYRIQGGKERSKRGESEE